MGCKPILPDRYPRRPDFGDKGNYTRLEQKTERKEDLRPSIAETIVPLSYSGCFSQHIFRHSAGSYMEYFAAVQPFALFCPGHIENTDISGTEARSGNDGI